VLKFSTQGYYKWLKAPCSARDLADAYLTNEAVDAHGEDPGYGYRLVFDELVAAGHEVGERRVWRLCSDQKLFSAHSKKRGKGTRPGPPVHDDRVRRDFSATRPNQLWLTDITWGCPRLRGSTGPARASSTAARSRTSTRAKSWATRSLIG